MRRLFLITLLLQVGWALPNINTCWAAPTLELSSLLAEPGQQVELALSLTGAEEEYAGINARLLLPPGIIPVGIDTGNLLASNSSQLLQRITAQDSNTILSLVLYSAEDSFNTDGELLKLQLQVSPSCNASAHDIQFSLADLIPELNSEHALANGTGSVSVNHVISNGQLTVGSTVTDTDGDKLSDFWENHYFGNLDQNGTEDGDHDGLSDYQEYINSTNPLSDDTDQDTLPDGWEVLYGTNPNIKDAADDLDGNGTSNLAEYLAGVWPEILAGDINNDKTVDLNDLILVLQIAAGLPVGDLYRDADINNDFHLGMAEGLYILQQVSDE